MGSLDVDPHWKYYSKCASNLINVCRRCPFLPYVSLVVPRGSTNSRVVLRRIVFTTTSHDQGFCDGETMVGKYQGSYSTFVARVLDPGGHLRVPEHHIQANMIGSPDFKTHVNCWDYRDTDLFGRDPSDYASSQGWWFSRIESGDRIQIVPTAFFLGWSNFVKEARIEIWTEELDERPRPQHRIFEAQGTSPYRRLNIQRKEIRLAVIEPQDDNSDAVRVSLQHTFLGESETASFEALSYCWGDVDELRPIMLKGFDKSDPDIEFQVTSNLFNALKCLRRSCTPRTFWIDFICINQSDIEERNQQVTLMRLIYASAQHVRVWLGESDERLKDHFNFIRNIAQKEQNPQPLTEDSSEQSISPLPATHLEIYHNTYIVGYDSIFWKLWFERVWVLQEVWSTSSISIDSPAKPTDRITVQQGDDELPWYLILRTNRCLGHYTWENKRRMASIWDSLFVLSKASDDSQLGYQPTPCQDILTVAIAGLDMQAIDRRDNIFALLGFGKETQDIAELPDLVRPDYQKTSVQVYSDFTRWWIEEHRSLRILSALHALTGRTWLDVFDLGSSEDEHEYFDDDSSQPPSWAWWYNGRSAWALGALASGETCEYQACGDQEVNMGLLRTSTSTILALRGIRIGNLSVLSYYPYKIAQRHRNLNRAYQWIFDPLPYLGIWRFPRIWKRTSSAPDEQEYAKAMYEHYGVHMLTNTSSDEMWAPCHGKIFFKTSNGDIGLCPAGARVGDIVTILHGGKVPYLLRSIKGSSNYKFIGECYVEGMMNGEAYSSKDRPGDKEDFLLA